MRRRALRVEGESISGARAAAIGQELKSKRHRGRACRVEQWPALWQASLGTGWQVQLQGRRGSAGYFESIIESSEGDCREKVKLTVQLSFRKERVGKPQIKVSSRGEAVEGGDARGGNVWMLNSEMLRAK